jgi:hypothetical protein
MTPSGYHSPKDPPTKLEPRAKAHPFGVSAATVRACRAFAPARSGRSLQLHGCCGYYLLHPSEVSRALRSLPENKEHCCGAGYLRGRSLQLHGYISPEFCRGPRTLTENKNNFCGAGYLRGIGLNQPFGNKQRVGTQRVTTANKMVLVMLEFVPRLTHGWHTLWAVTGPRVSRATVVSLCSPAFKLQPLSCRETSCPANTQSPSQASQGFFSKTGHKPSTTERGPHRSRCPTGQPGRSTSPIARL